MRPCAASASDDRRQQYLTPDQSCRYRPFELLRRLYGEIHIADGVWYELNKGGRRHPGSHEVESASWVRRQEVSDQNLVVVLRRDLDSGEAETLLRLPSS